MMTVSNLSIDFKKISVNQSIKKDSVNLLFLKDLKEMKFKPIWLSLETEKFLINSSKARKIKKPHLFENMFLFFQTFRCLFDQHPKVFFDMVENIRWFYYDFISKNQRNLNTTTIHVQKTDQNLEKTNI